MENIAESTKKALTIQQPFALAIMKGIKRIELRSWQTKYRGRLFIHAGAKKISGDLKNWKYLNMKNETFEYGAILGYVTLKDVKLLDLLNFLKYRNYNKGGLHPLDIGMFGWILENPVIFDQPVPYKGQLGLYPIELDESLMVVNGKKSINGL